jgi:hypothetical protein
MLIAQAFCAKQLLCEPLILPLHISNQLLPRLRFFLLLLELLEFALSPAS